MLETESEVVRGWGLLQNTDKLPEAFHTEAAGWPMAKAGPGVQKAEHSHKGEDGRSEAITWEGQERLWEQGSEADLLPYQWEPTKGSPPGWPGAALT